MAKNRRQVALPSPPEMRHTAQAKANVTREWFTVATAQAGTTTTATVHINDTIGEDMFFGGVDSAALIAEIDGLRVDQLDVRINSLGGNAHDGMAIANAILRNKAATTTYIDGIAASAASVIALAADRVVISKYGQMMVHNSSGLAVGGAEDIRGYANYLDSLDATMADYYADRAGGDTKTWAKAMKAETWYRAEEALAAGLVTDIDTSAVREDVEASITAAMASPAAQFMNVGRPAVPAAARADTSKEAPVADKKTLAESLGLGADATEEDILKATRDTLGITDDDTETPPGTQAATRVRSTHPTPLLRWGRRSWRPRSPQRRKPAGCSSRTNACSGWSVKPVKVPPRWPRRSPRGTPRRSTPRSPRARSCPPRRTSTPR